MVQSQLTVTGCAV